jgi:hypothetical protein
MGTKEFVLLDPDNNLLTFKQNILFTDYLETAAANSGFARLRIWW